MSWRFAVVNETLYKKSFLGSWLRYVGPLHANYVLREIHDGSCSMHAGTRSVVAKALRTGYYWPTMHRDARTLIRVCQDCQVHKPVPRNPQQKLTPITSPWPFYKWGIDIAGPFPEGSGKVKFLIVAMDYFTKWIEAKPVATITGNQIKKFVWDNVVCRFGLPGEIISNNGKQFRDDPFKDWCEKLCMPTPRTAEVDLVRNNEALEINLDLLEQMREEAAIREAKNTRKLGPKWEGPYEVTKTLGKGAYKLRGRDEKQLPRTWNINNLKKCHVYKMDFTIFVKKTRRNQRDSRALDKDATSHVLREEEAIYLKTFNEALFDEERFLKQKAKVEWLCLGDTNSSYFHKMVKARVCRSRIEAVNDSNNVLQEDKPWVLMGDFNATLNIEDTFFGSSDINISMREFRECVETIEVRDVNSTGLHYTWNQKPKADTSMLRKIDRVLSNMLFRNEFSSSYVVFQPYRISDHAPVVITKQKPFKFLNFIVFYKAEFNTLVLEGWQKVIEVLNETNDNFDEDNVENVYDETGSFLANVTKETKGASTPLKWFLMFSVASWNITGLNRAPKQKEVWQVINENHLQACAILESRVDIAKLEKRNNKKEHNDI
nr:reverse transcriptase domain-containing protein [Tanacetum cinerariifolium]